MSFESFIKSLNDEDKENYNKYCKVRGFQQYKIIYETLCKIDSNVTYKDVNSFIRLDKAIKDILYKYLGALEETIKTKILLEFDFDSPNGLKERYSFFDNRFPKTRCKRRSNPSYEITEFYKRFALNFSGIVLFIKEYMADEYDVDKLDSIVDFRNCVMHHSPLLFNYNFESMANKTMEKIEILVELLPNNYKKNIIENLKYVNEETKKNISKSYYECLLYKE